MNKTGEFIDGLLQALVIVVLGALAGVSFVAAFGAAT